MLPIGSKAPVFDLEGSDGNRTSSKQLIGKNVVIVFYPCNNTPGWDRQLAALEAARTQFESINTVVLGINFASVKSHESYCEKKGFAFPILSDPGEKVLIEFKSQKPAGKGVFRTVYALDTTGKVIFAERGQPDYLTIMETIRAAM